MRKEIKTAWLVGEIEKVYEAIDKFNNTFTDKLCIKGMDKEDSFIFLTISYSEAESLLYLGLYLGRAGV